jgi:hypothetical protein
VVVKLGAIQGVDAVQLGNLMSRASDDFRVFLQECVWIQDATSEATIRWEWWPVHAQMVLDTAQPRLVELKARQVSGSWFWASYAVWRAMWGQNAKVLVISQGQREADEFLGKCRFIRDHVPWPTLAGKPDNTVTLSFLPSDGSITALPSSENAGSGFTASLVIVDEAAKHPHADANYAAYKPTIDAGGQLVIVSSAHGVGNFFHRMYVAARARQNGFSARFYSWRVRPGRDQAWYDRQVVEYAATPGLIDQEYPTVDDDAFLLSGNPRFDLEAIKVHRERERAPLPGAALPPDLRRLPGLSVWVLPVAGQPYVMGSDVAEGLEGGDYSVSMVVNARTLEHVASLHGTWQPGAFAEYSIELGLQYNKALWGWERNNHGHTVTRVADVEYHYPRMYWHEESFGELSLVQRRAGQEAGRRLGFPTTRVTKPMLIDGVDEAIRTFGLTSYDGEFWSEAQTYVREASGETNASEGNHDDRVIALALARYLALQPGASVVRAALGPLERAFSGLAESRPRNTNVVKLGYKGPS